MKHLINRIVTLSIILETCVVSFSLAEKKTVGQLLSQAKIEKNKKSSLVLPDANLGFIKAANSINLNSVKPPKSSEVMKKDTGGSNKSEYERILNQQIQELFKLTQKFKGSPNRGELWLRLAELYVEKAGLIDSRKQDEYDAKLKDFQSKKILKMPVLNTAEARDYNRKSIQLYEWFERDFPQDEKIAQALFFLGYNYFEIGEVGKGSKYYEDLTKRFPESSFVGEAHFALAEYYFENDKWAPAYKEYSFIIKQKKHRLYTFALYKGAWCLFRLDRVQQGMSYLEYIIKTGRAETGDKVAGQRTVNRTRLEGEALRDIVSFYAEGGDTGKAQAYFQKLVGKDVRAYLERLAYQYADRSKKEASREIFKLLIAEDPTAPKAFEYQYQIVQNLYYAKNTSQFKDELYKWVTDYSVNSPWTQKNKDKAELILNSNKLRESTLRNYVLQQHQTAQNSRAAFSQGQAFEGYELYLREFPDTALAGDMHFYFGELLFDLQKYEDASVQYKWVVDHSPNSKFYSQAAENLILSVERSVPSDNELQKKVGNSIDPIPLEPRIERLVSITKWYIEKFPKTAKALELKFRIARLYYQANQFDEAAKLFNQIIHEGPQTKYAEYSANLILDIYNLKKDYTGLEKAARDILTVPAIANSKAGVEIRTILEKSAFKKGQDLELQKNYGESAQAFEAFSKVNPKSVLAMTALFNAAINYERSGLSAQAIAAYQGVLSSKDPAAEKFKIKSRRLLAKQYQETAQFEEAAKQYKISAKENENDPLAANMIFNSAVLYEALGDSNAAIKSYTEFMKKNKKRSENLDIEFSMAQIHRKAGQTSAAISRYTEYVDGGGRDPEKVIEASYWATVLYKRQRSITKSKEWSGKTISIQKRLAASKKGVGASYAAKLKLENVMLTFSEMKSITFPKDPVRQQAAVNRKSGLLTRLAGELAEVIKYDSAEEIVTSLTILGEAYLNMAQTIRSAPLPNGLNPEEKKQYMAGVEKYAEAPMLKSKESFKLAVDRAWELEVYNDSYHTAFEEMNKLDPKAYYDGGEVGTDIRLVNWIGQK